MPQSLQTLDNPNMIKFRRKIDELKLAKEKVEEIKKKIANLNEKNK